MAPRILCALLAAAFAFAGFGGTDVDFDFDRRYAGAAGALVLPQGDGDLRRRGGGALRAGYYFTDTVALDGEVAVLENTVGLAVRGLWHLQGFEEFGRLFGYERFDPFVTAGARGWLADGEVGPSAGVGALYYLTDSWALRFDADFTLGLERRVETAHTLAVGVQYSF